MRKAQMKQVFIYLGAIMVIGTLVTIGFQSTSQLMTTSCKATNQEFKANLFDVLDANKGPGNVQQADLNAPCDTTMICAGGSPSGDVAVSAVNTTLQTGTEENIFMIANGEIKNAYAYDSLADNPANCTAAQSGSFEVLIQGEPGGDVTLS